MYSCQVREKQRPVEKFGSYAIDIISACVLGPHMSWLWLWPESKCSKQKKSYGHLRIQHSARARSAQASLDWKRYNIRKYININVHVKVHLLLSAPTSQCHAQFNVWGQKFQHLAGIYDRLSVTLHLELTTKPQIRGDWEKKRKKTYDSSRLTDLSNFFSCLIFKVRHKLLWNCSTLDWHKLSHWT